MVGRTMERQKGTQLRYLTMYTRLGWLHIMETDTALFVIIIRQSNYSVPFHMLKDEVVAY